MITLKKISLKKFHLKIFKISFKTFQNFISKNSFLKFHPKTSILKISFRNFYLNNFI